MPAKSNFYVYTVHQMMSGLNIQLIHRYHQNTVFENCDYRLKYMEKNKMIIYSQENNDEIFKNNPNIIIDDRFDSLIDIYNFFGCSLYGEKTNLNPIEIGIYFGCNLDSFSDCLRSYLYSYGTITITIKSKNDKISDYDFFKFIHLLICITSIYELNKKLKLIISLDIMKMYSLEVLSLIQANNEEIIY